MKTIMVTVFALCVAGCALDSAEDHGGQQASEEEFAAISDKLAAMDEVAAELISPTPNHAACGRNGPNLQNQVIANAASPSGGAQQRSGSSTGCVAVGVLQPTDDARYFCFTFANDGFTWTFLRNVRTGVLGWTRDDLLRNFGSNRHCGF